MRIGDSVPIARPDFPPPYRENGAPTPITELDRCVQWVGVELDPFDSLYRRQPEVLPPWPTQAIHENIETHAARYGKPLHDIPDVEGRADLWIRTIKKSSRPD